jgi:hypothetical protein
LLKTRNTVVTSTFIRNVAQAHFESLDPTEQYLNNIAYSTSLSWLPAKFNPVGKYYQYDSTNTKVLGYGLFDQQYRLVVPCSGLYRFRVTVAGTPS